MLTLALGQQSGKLKVFHRSVHQKVRLALHVIVQIILRVSHRPINVVRVAAKPIAIAHVGHLEHAFGAARITGKSGRAFLRLIQIPIDQVVKWGHALVEHHILRVLFKKRVKHNTNSEQRYNLVIEAPTIDHVSGVKVTIRFDRLGSVGF